LGGGLGFLTLNQPNPNQPVYPILLLSLYLIVCGLSLIVVQGMEIRHNIDGVMTPVVHDVGLFLNMNP
jgi:hypothetical protein